MYAQIAPHQRGFSDQLVRKWLDSVTTTVTVDATRTYVVSKSQSRTMQVRRQSFEVCYGSGDDIKWKFVRGRISIVRYGDSIQLGTEVRR